MVATAPASAVGIDIGGTKMLGVRVAATSPGEPLAVERRETPAGTDAVLDGVVELVSALDPGGTGPIGLGIPGLVDRDGIFRYGPNLPDVVGVPVRDELARRLGRMVRVDNDATCATVAEFTVGVGAGVTDGILVTLGTGIGAGLVVDGAVRRGRHGFAAEAGHMVIDPAGPVCPCGRRGCWERLASGSGLRWLARQAAVSGRIPDVVDVAGGGLRDVRGEHVVARALAGSSAAGDVLDDFAWWVAAGLANLVGLSDPQLVVIGGGVVEAGDVILDRVRAALPNLVFAAAHRPAVEVAGATFGERAGAIGAALWAMEAQPGDI